MKCMRRIVFSFGLLVAACGTDENCTHDIPFTIEESIDVMEAARLRNEIRVLSTDELAGMCDAVCTQLRLEVPRTDSSTFHVETVESCTLVLPSTDADGNPVDGSIHCAGAGTKCILRK